MEKVKINSKKLNRTKEKQRTNEIHETQKERISMKIRVGDGLQEKVNTWIIKCYLPLIETRALCKRDIKIIFREYGPCALEFPRKGKLK